MPENNAMAWWRVIKAGVFKNWRLSVSYPSWIANRLLGPVVWVSLAVYAYTGIAEPAAIADAFERAGEGGSFTGFLILGQTIFSFFMGINWRGGVAIQRERWYGTLEMILLAPTSRMAYILGESIYGLIDSGWTVFLAMLVAGMVFGIGFDVADPLAVVLVLVLTLLAMLALGLFFAGFYVLTRSAAPLSQAVASPVRFLSGSQFPVAALPALAQAIAYALPVTYGLIAVRQVLLDGQGLADVADTLGWLVLMTVVFSAAGAWLVHRMELRAKRTGSLHAY